MEKAPIIYSILKAAILVMVSLRGKSLKIMKAQITKIFRGKSRAAFEKSVIVLRFDRKFVSRYYFYKYIKKHVCLLLKLITRQTTSFFDRIKYQSFFKRRIGMEKKLCTRFYNITYFGKCLSCWRHFSTLTLL